MPRDSLRTACLGAALLALFALGGCGAPSPREPPPPPPQSAAEPAQPPQDLLGGPSSQPAAPQAIESAAPAEPEFSGMLPIPNPEQGTPEDRGQGRGHASHRGPPTERAPRQHHHTPTSRSAAASTGHVAALANGATGAGVPANAAVPGTDQHQRRGGPTAAQPTSGLGAATSALPPIPSAASAAASSSAVPSGTEGPANTVGAPAAGLAGKVIVGVVILLIAIIAVIAAWRSSMRPRGRPPTYGARLGRPDTDTPPPPWPAPKDGSET